MSGIYKGLTIRIGADTTGLSSALNGIDRQTRGLKREMSAVNKALKLDPGNTELVRQKMSAYQREVKQTADRLRILKEAESQIGKEGMSTEAWDTLQREIASTEGKLRNLTAEYREFAVQQAAAQSRLGRAGAAVSELGAALDPVGRKMQSAGRSLTMGLTLPIAAAAGASVKAAMDIDTGLTDVRKTVDGTAEDYARLKEAAIEFSKVNAVGAAEMLSIESLGAQLGYTLDLMSNGKSEVQEFGEVVSGLDIATNMSAEQAGTELAQFFNIMQENKELTENYGSTIVGLGNNFATTESDVSAMALRIAGAGKSIGLTSADVLGLATALTSLGIEAEMGGTAISTVMSSIDKSVALQDENLATWAETAHMSVEEFSRAWGQDAVGALDAVLKGMGQNVEEGGNLSVMLDDLGISSLRQTDMMKRLANSGDLMSRSVARANEEWERNDALSNEVANRNDSLAAKFEMLKNRVIAVAEEVGAPLADALLGAVDAAQPLFEEVERGASTFSEMDEGQQRVVMTTVALIAALGPSLSTFGKLATSAKVVGGAMEGLSRFIASARTGSVGFAESLEKVRAAQERHVASLGTESAALRKREAQLVSMQRQYGATGKAANLAKTAMAGIGATVGIGLALVAVEKLATALVDMHEKAEIHRKATDGLREAADKMKRSSEVAAIGAADLGDSTEHATAKLGSYREAAEQAAEKGAALADAISSQLDESDASAALVQAYSDRILELAGNCDGSSGKLTALNDAVSHYNELTGASLSVVDDFSGRLSEQNDVIRENTELFKLNVEQKAYAEVAAESAKRVAELTVEIERQTSELENHSGILDGLISSGQATYDEFGNLTGAAAIEEAAIRELSGSIADLSLQRGDAEAVVDSALDHEASLGEAYDEQAQKVEDARKTVEDFRAALESVSPDTPFDELAANVGLDADGLAQKLSDSGVSVEEFAALGADNFARFYDSASGSMDGVLTALDAVNAFHLDPKEFEVIDNGTIQTQDGHVYDFNKQTIDDKPFEVTDKGSVDKENSLVDALIGHIQSVPDEIVSHFHEEGAAGVISTVHEVRDAIDDVRDKTVTLTVKVNKEEQNAAGGLSPQAVKAIPRHADGGLTGVVTRATMTNVGWVGEDGAEYLHDFGGGTAIVPIQNSRYVRPLASAIAAAMPQQGLQAAQQPVSVHIDGARVNGDAQVQAIFYELFDTLARKGMMKYGR